MSHVTFSGATDMGKRRSNNEDAYIAQNIWDDDHILAVAIDGVGGYEGGEVAAELARKSIIDYLEKYHNGERLELLKQAVVSANNTIFSERKLQPQYSNMSCVLTAALVEVKDRRINMAHVGDTRLYQFANGIITKLSHDHSLVGYREEIGELTEIEAMNHPQRNVIGRDVGSRLLGNSGDDYIETTSFPLISNSMLLLCSDGLCDMITSEQMTSILLTDNTVEDKASMLIDAANAAGGKDNITVVLVDINIGEGRQIMTFTKEKINDTADSDKNTFNSQNNDQFSNKKTRCGVIILLGILFLIIGYFAGGYSAPKVMPSVFPANTIIDTIYVKTTPENILPYEDEAVKILSELDSIKTILFEKDKQIDSLRIELENTKHDVESLRKEREVLIKQIVE